MMRRLGRVIGSLVVCFLAAAGIRGFMVSKSAGHGLALEMLSHEACAFEFIYSSEGRYLQWARGAFPIPYQVNVTYLPDVVEPVGAIVAAFQTWDNVSSAGISFNYGGTTFEEMGSEQNGVNMVAWSAEAFIAGMEVPTTIGVTYIAWFDEDTLEFQEVDIALHPNPLWFDPTFGYLRVGWSTTGEPLKIDVQGVTTHEVGHLLGLGHSLDPTATMIDGGTFYSTHTVGDEIRMRNLYPDDIEGITLLYPAGFALSGASGRGGGCFIATAAFGTPLAAEVRGLSQFRDKYLLTNPAGKWFVREYEQLSPIAARVIQAHPALKVATRVVLWPVVDAARMFEEGL